MTLDMGVKIPIFYTFNYFSPHATHHAKFDFDPTTWVVWTNSQFANVLGVFFLPYFLSSFLFLFPSPRLQVAPADESSPI